MNRIMGAAPGPVDSPSSSSAWLSLCLRLIRIVSLLVPHDRRREWRDEWEGEVVYRWQHISRVRAPAAAWSSRLPGACALASSPVGATPPALPCRAARVALLVRTAGCLPHAISLWKEAWRPHMIWQDLRYAARTLWRRPAFTLTAALTLALATGALTAIFSIVYTVLLKPLPFHEPERLVQIWETNPNKGWTENIVAPANLMDWRVRTRTLDGIAAYNAGFPGRGAGVSFLTLTGTGDAEPIAAMRVSANFFDVLGAHAGLGRTFGPDEDLPEHKVIVISDATWRRRFDASPAAIGRSMQLNGEPHTIIGVMPPSFLFHTREVELWIGFNLTREQLLTLRRPHMLRTVARLKPGVTLDQARADLTGIMTQLSREYPDTNETMGAGMGPMQEWVVGPSRQKLLLFLGAVAFVLLIACTNVASLLTVQGLARARELALRTALGARRGRLVRLLLTESLVLSAAGGTLGLAVTVWMVRMFVAFSPGDVPRLEEVRVDTSMLLFAAATSFAATILFGLLPAMQAARPDLTGILRDGGRGTSGGLRGHRMRWLLVAGEVALALLLVIGAGLLIRSFIHLQRIDSGLTREPVLTFNVSLPTATYGKLPDVRSFTERLTEGLRAIPGVRAVGATTGLPLDGGWTGDSTIEGRPPDDFISQVSHKTVSLSYFDSIGLRIVDGRGFLPSDRAQPPGEKPPAAAPPGVASGSAAAARAAAAAVAEPEWVIIVNQALARRHFPTERAVGRRLTFSKPSLPGRWYTIVGVIQDEPTGRLHEKVVPQIYVPTSQDPQRTLAWTVRADVSPASLLPSVRGVVRTLDPAIPLVKVGTLGDLISESVAAERFATMLMTAFAAVALALAIVGIYGVVSFSVSQRTQEIGVRLALGASPRDVRRLVIRQALQPVIVGLVVGLALAFAAARLLSRQLFEISPTDPATFAAVTSLFLVVALLASYLPARRAMSVEPVEALRLD